MNPQNTRRSIIRQSVSAVAVVAALQAVPAVSAQESTASDNEELIMDEIVVTAGRRVQNLQDVPAAVAAISPDSFKYKGMQRVQDVVEYTPGIQFNTGGNTGRGSISARGVPQAEATPVFGIYLDDTPVSTNTGFSAGGTVFLDALLLDLERVEVIKGPQGTLYGATSVGGMLRYISRDPALEEVRATASADFSTTKNGEWGEVFSGRVSVPLIEDKLGITASAFHQHTGGYVDYVDGDGAVLEKDVDGGETQGFAGDLLYRPTDNLEIRLKYMRQDVDSMATSDVRLSGTDNNEPLFDDYTNIAAPAPSSIDYEIFSGSLNYDLGWATLTSTSSKVNYSVLSEQDFTAAYAGFVDFLDGRDPGTTTAVNGTFSLGSRKFVQEVRLTSEGEGNLEWIAGLYYADEDTYNSQAVHAEPFFDALTASFPSFYKEYAAFGDVTYYLNENFDVTAGVRISHSKTNLSYTTSGALVGTADLVTPEVEDTIGTYLFAARYRPTEDLSLYARVASGYRPAQTNLPIVDPVSGENVAPLFIEADKAWSYEIGAKGSLADGMMTYDVALWMIDWANFQSATVSNGVATGGNAQDGLSAHGVEAEFVFRPTDALTLTANGTYTSSTLNEDEPGFGGVGGEQYPNLAKWTGAFKADYNFAVSGDWTGALGAGLRLNDSYMSTFGASTSQVPVKVKGRAIADLNLGFSNDRYTIGFYATNLFNSKSLIRRKDAVITGTGVDSTGFYTRPRTIGVNLRVDI